MIMPQNDQTIYALLLWALPVLLAILGFIGALAVKSLMQMSKDVNEIKVSITQVSTKHDELNNRVERLEDRVFA